MKRNLLTTIITYCILTLAGVVSFVLPEELVVQQAGAVPSGEVVRLNGIVRDFQKTNTNFAVMPAAGSGHYAGNVQLNLNAQQRPAYAGTGFKVSSQWRDKDNYRIAPHMYRNAAAMRTVRLVNAPLVTGTPTLDTFDSTAGAYGPSNKGPAPTFATGQTMPVLAEPTGMPALIAEYLRDGAGTTVLNADINCNKFLIRNSHVLQINGNRRVLVHEEMMVENFAKIQLLPNAILQIWVKKDATIKNNIDMNLNTADPSRFTIYNLGVNNFTIENSASSYFNLVAPNGGLHVKNSAQFCGQYTGKNITIDNGCGVHIDTRGAPVMCGVDFADIAGAAGAASNGGIPSATAFSYWFQDVMGENLSAVHSIELTKNASGVYEYLDNSFFPIDGQLFGNEGDAHNYYFTYGFNSRFTFDKCANQYFEFDGADDVWLFVNGQLAIDLGGINPATAQRISFDRFNLVDGQKYSLLFFYAQRNTAIARMNIRTNVELEGENFTYTMSAGID